MNSFYNNNKIDGGSKLRYSERKSSTKCNPNIGITITARPQRQYPVSPIGIEPFSVP